MSGKADDETTVEFEDLYPPQDPESGSQPVHDAAQKHSSLLGKQFGSLLTQPPTGIF